MKLVTGIILILMSFTAYAATPSPITQVTQVTDQVLSQLKAKKATLKKDPEVVYKIIRTVLMPRVDTDMMSKSVLGRAGWAKATPEQQKQFISLFSTLMTYTYSTALAKHSDQSIKYFPIHGSYEGRTMIVVNSQVEQPEGPPINLSYNLILHGEQWQVYDISVEGISLLQSFRDQFAAILNDQGMGALLDTLSKHNAALARSNKEGTDN